MVRPALRKCALSTWIEAPIRQHGLIAYCLNDSCRHSALIDVSKYADDVEVPSFPEARQVWQVRRQTRRRKAELEERPTMPTKLPFD
jgi:hypothetical protein